MCIVQNDFNVRCTEEVLAVSKCKLAIGRTLFSLIRTLFCATAPRNAKPTSASKRLSANDNICRSGVIRCEFCRHQCARSMRTDVPPAFYLYGAQTQRRPRRGGPIGCNQASSTPTTGWNQRHAPELRQRRTSLRRDRYLTNRRAAARSLKHCSG